MSLQRNLRCQRRRFNPHIGRRRFQQNLKQSVQLRRHSHADSLGIWGAGTAQILPNFFANTRDFNLPIQLALAPIFHGAIGLKGVIALQRRDVRSGDRGF